MWHSGEKYQKYRSRIKRKEKNGKGFIKQALTTRKLVYLY